MTALTTIVLLVAMFAGGCSSPLVKVAPEPPPGYVITKEVSATACGVHLGPIPIMINSRTERAYKLALQRAKDKGLPAEGLMDTTITDTWKWIFIGVRSCTTIEGTGFRSAGSAGE